MSRQKVKFERDGNRIIITLPKQEDADKGGQFCAICGTEGTEKSPILKVDRELKHKAALLKKITDSDRLCRRCFNSVTALATELTKQARENIPQTHTVSLPFVFVRDADSGYIKTRLLKPDAEETAEYIKNDKGGIVSAHRDPYLLESFEGWEKNAKIYERYEAIDEKRYGRLYDEELNRLTNDDEVLEALAARFYMKLKERMEKDTKNGNP